MKVIVGGGAAGLFAAIRCKEKDPVSNVVVLEKTNQLLSKVRISGGGRCNVTHACLDPKKMASHYPRGSKELIGPFHTFGPQETINWFEARGIKLKTEADGRMFPTTDSSETIIEALLAAARDVGVEIQKQARIQSVTCDKGQFVIELNDEQLFASHLLLATGSAPWGTQLASCLGHTLVPPVPSLFTFNVPTSPLLDLAGISVPHAILTLNECHLSETGPLLLTHWGFSGPAALKLSAWGALKLHALAYKTSLTINWIGTNVFQELLALKKRHPNQLIPVYLPAKLQKRLLGPSVKTPLGSLSDQMLKQIADKLNHDTYQIDGKTTYKSEFVTAGGIELKEINFKTMESRLIPHLYFAGEILNIDGITGGFNFQNAWTTGYLAGTAMSLTA